MRQGIGITIAFFLLISIYNPLNGQNLIACDPYELCRANIGSKFNPSEKLILLENWNDFAGVSLEQQFPISNKALNVVSIRLDGLGCVYPSFITDGQFRKPFLHEGFPQTEYTKCSFFDIYRFDRHERILYSKINEEIASTLDLNMEGKLRNAGKETDATSIYDFRATWNQHFLEEINAQLKSVIVNKGIKQVFFFIHGFNVPYALAHLQGNKIFNAVLENQPSGVNADEVLFVRVFWPSLSEKRSDFVDGNCDVRNRGLRVVSSKLYSYVTNRAYLAGNTLNDIISTLPPTLSINVMTHSFGSVVANAIVFSPRSKMKHLNTPLNKALLREFGADVGAINYKLNFFLNAPAMPGKSSFTYLREDSNDNHYFYVGHNRKDKRLLKRIVFGIQFPRKKNSSSLGCNYLGAAKRVERQFKKRGLTQHFFHVRTSKKREHDFFCYGEQEEFKTFFRQYLKDVSTRVNF